MKKKLFILCMFFAALMLFLYYFLSDSNLSAVHDVKSALEENGYQVEIKELEKDILRGDRYQLTLNADKDLTVIVYVYASVEKAKEDANTITEDGFGIERASQFGIAECIQIEWVAAPHFFLYENQIVQYIGMDFDLLQCLRKICGNQIAGQPFIDSPLIERAIMPKTVQYFPGNDVQEFTYPLLVEKSVDNC